MPRYAKRSNSHETLTSERKYNLQIVFSYFLKLKKKSPKNFIFLCKTLKLELINRKNNSNSKNIKHFQYIKHFYNFFDFLRFITYNFDIQISTAKRIISPFVTLSLIMQRKWAIATSVLPITSCTQAEIPKYVIMGEKNNTK